MKTLELKVDEHLHNRQIKSILKNHFNLSSAIITTAKQYPDGILLNFRRAIVTEYVKTGDLLQINIHDEKSKNIDAVSMSLDILYEDEDILALNKPSNMPTHPSQNHHDDTLANGVMFYYKDADFTFRVITRLDRETSGVVLIAKNAVSAQRLSAQMKNKQISKQYIAVCHNVPANPSNVINAPIARMDNSTIKRIVKSDGKYAETMYELIKTVFTPQPLSVLRVFPQTGRTHQIRVHLSYIGCPIYGDNLYGSNIVNERTRLHCSQISFMHPFNKRILSIFAPIPQDMII